jgi:hypothetical protein
VNHSPFRPGDQVKLASGRTVILCRRRDDGTWIAQYVEDAKQQTEEYIMVAEKDLPKETL